MLQLLLCLSLLAAPATEDTIVLAPGAEKTLTLPHLARIAVADPEVADVTPVGAGAVKVKALAAGSTTLKAWTADGALRNYTIFVDDGTRPPPAQPKLAVKPAAPATQAPAEGGSLGGQALENATCDNPTAPEVAKPWAAALAAVKAKRCDDAIPLLTAVLQIQPNVARAYLYLGQCSAMNRDLATGAACYETFALSCPDHPQTRDVKRILDDYRRAKRE